MNTAVTLLAFALGTPVLSGYTAVTPADQATVAQTPPQKLRVAFVVSERFNMMDFAGPWEVFQDAALPQPTSTRWEENPRLFQLYTVSETTAPVKSTGGAVFVPSHTFADAPKPDIVVIGAQSLNSPALHAWLRDMHAQKVFLMSVCVGAGKLAEAGLLNGLRAATHHDYVERYRGHYTDVKWESGQRYVRSSETIYTAGGLTSGIDLALRVVAERFGEAVAQGTADYMEYTGQGWKGGAQDRKR